MIYLLLIKSKETITLSEVSAAYGDAQSTMFGGNMNWGGMKTRERRGETPDFSRGPQPEQAESEQAETEQAESEQGVPGQVPGDTLPFVESDAGETDHAVAEQESESPGKVAKKAVSSPLFLMLSEELFHARGGYCVSF